jgi:DNA-binding NarL/FixJ family response regulator
VLLVDDSVAIQQGFGALLAAAPGIDVVACADDLASAIASISSHHSDLIVLDAKLRGHDKGIDVLRPKDGRANSRGERRPRALSPRVASTFVAAGAEKEPLRLPKRAGFQAAPTCRARRSSVAVAGIFAR